MYNLTYLGHRVTLPWLDLRSNFDLDLSRSSYTWFDAPWRGKHDGIKIVALPLKLKILSSKNRFGKFCNFGPWRPQFWPEPKNDRNDFEMIFSRAFERRFPFCSTMSRSRDRRWGGGGVQTPPSRWWKIQRPIRARVNKGTFHTGANINSHDAGRDISALQARKLTFWNHKTAKLLEISWWPSHSWSHP